MSSRVSVVIPNWNGKDLMADCLDSVRAQTHRNLEVIVVDNGSVDGSVDFVRSEYPEVNVVPLTSNRGFAGGVNEGIRVAGGELVALLNNDAVAEPQWLEHLVRVMNTRSQTGIVSSKILKLSSRGASRATLDSTGVLYSVWGLAFSRGLGELDDGQYDAPGEVFAASGGACLCRRQMLSEVGLFDEHFFAYSEDVDLSFRARLAGWTVDYEPRARVWHRSGATSGGEISAFARYHSIKNMWLLYVKDLPGVLFWRYLPRLVLWQTYLLASSLKNRKNGLLKAHLKGVLAGLILTPKMLSRRAHTQRHRRLASIQLDELLVHALPPGQTFSRKAHAQVSRAAR